MIATVTRTGAGVLVFQLSNADTFNKVIYLSADLDDSAADGRYATCGNVTNEGTATGIAFTVRTRAATGTLTDFGTGGTGAATKLSVSVIFRNTASAP